jgi:hypothetical protein
MNLYLVSFLPALTIATYLAMGPGAYIVIIQSMYHESWKSKVKILPALLVYNAGMSVNNSVAVFDAVFGKKNEFLRTPKYGIITKNDNWKDKSYNLPFTKTTLLEIFFGVYGLMGILISIFSNNPIFAPIIGLQTVGFFYISFMSLSHTSFKRNKSLNVSALTKKEKMEKRAYQLAMIGVLGIIVFGAFMSINGYHADVYPLDRIRGNLDGIISSADPEAIKIHLTVIKQDLVIVMEKLPESKNPVWVFPTESTNFLRIDRDIDNMLITAQTLTTVSPDSAAFQTGMTNIGERSLSLRQNIMDATPYMFVSISNIIFSTMWIAAILGVFAILKRKKDQLNKFDEVPGV